MKKSLVGIVVAMIVAALALPACGGTDADVASHNLSQAAEQFEVERRVVFVNGITDKYILSVEGLCSIEDRAIKLEVTCKLGDGEFVKHYLGRSDNVTYFVEQLRPENVSTSHYRVIFKPSVIVPDVDIP